jgi:UTP--glucose-1-phosphate uridylyltransferase
MTSRVTKAVIPAAGLGTRFLPATKAQPKEMLPLVDKPTIQYIVEEAVRAGITDILIVTGRSKRAIEDHFDRSVELEAVLEKGGKHDALEEMRSIAEMANIHFVRQGEPKGLGHAVLMARHHVGDEPFAVMLGDDVMHAKSNVFTSMLDANQKTGKSVIALKEVARDEISAYGCAAVSETDGNLVKISGIVEKPKAEDAPSNLAVMGRYVLTPDIFDILEQTAPGAGGEIQLTDALAQLITSSALYGYTFDWGRFDIGKKIDFLRATVELALERDDLGPEFRKFLQEVVDRDGKPGA